MNEHCISSRYCRATNQHEVLLNGKSVHTAQNEYDRDMFIAELTARLQGNATRDTERLNNLARVLEAGAVTNAGSDEILIQNSTGILGRGSSLQDAIDSM